MRLCASLRVNASVLSGTGGIRITSYNVCYTKLLRGAGADSKQAGHPAPVLDHDGEAAILAAAGCGGQPIHDFLLQHEMHVPDAARLRKEVKQQRRGDVIGQITDNTQGRRRIGQLAEINPQGIGVVQGQFTCLTATFTQGSYNFV